MLIKLLRQIHVVGERLSLKKDLKQMISPDADIDNIRPRSEIKDKRATRARALETPTDQWEAERLSACFSVSVACTDT